MQLGITGLGDVGVAYRQRIMLAPQYVSKIEHHSDSYHVYYKPADAKKPESFGKINHVNSPLYGDSTTPRAVN